MIACGDPIGAGEIWHAQGEVGVGIEESRSRSRVAHRMGGRHLDLHETQSAPQPDRPRVVVAFATNDSVHQLGWNSVRLRMLRDQSMKSGVLCDGCSREHDGGSKK